MSQRQFIPHAEGFRGFAILLVIFFHLFPTTFRNAYVGVDIFLALSGYFLIRSLCADTETPFSFPRFLVKKVHRLAAPAAPIILLTVLASWLLFPLPEFTSTIKTALAALFGYSNIQLDSLTSGYFAESTQLNPYTHTWYMGVTLQAYLIFGAIAWALCRCPGKYRLWAMLAVGAISAIFTSHGFLKWAYNGPHPEVYYWTSARLAELAAGGLAVPLSRLRIPRYPAIILGTFAMLFPVYATFTHHHHLSQVVALTTTLLVALPALGPVKLVLENKFLRFLGRISFSTFLVHWPIAVFSRYYLGEFHGVSIVLIPLLCIAVGWVFYIITEHAGKTRTLIQWCVAVVFVALACTLPSEKLSIHPQSDALVGSHNEVLMAVNCPDYPGDVIPEWPLRSWADAASTKAVPQQHRVYRLGDDKAPVSFVLIGDSHARSIAPGLDLAARELGVQGYYPSIYLTPFYDRMYGNSEQRFDGKMAAAMCTWLKQHPEINTVVIVQCWSLRMAGEPTPIPLPLEQNRLPLHYDGTPVLTTDPYPEIVAALEQFCTLIRNTGKRVVLMTEAPSITETKPEVVLRRAVLTGQRLAKNSLVCTAEDYRRTCARSLRTLEELEQKGLITLVRCDKLITEETPFISWNDEGVLMMDDKHLSIIGSLHVGRRMKEAWRAVLAPAPEPAH